MKIYLKNTNTGKIISLTASSYKAVPKNFRKQPYVKAYTEEIKISNVGALKEKLILNRKAFLQKTNEDFLRSLEDHRFTLPQELKEKRLLAYDEINEIELLEDLKALQEYSENF